ncbi:MAG TPA: hypothetical protein PKA82_07895 [Pyrinomonadaceae bacterium]|nr:hypothetical protein [Acidobacteriota bacterium]HMT07911.1 hypothetical protein [Pyrinomonadaceae bacterium]
MNKTKKQNEEAHDMSGVHRISPDEIAKHFGTDVGGDEENPTAENIEIRLRLSAATLKKAKILAEQSGVGLSRYVEKALEPVIEVKGMLPRDG